VQTGQIPAHWKPLTTIGTGVMELKIRINGEYRVIYVAKFTEAIYVLHVFAKKTPKTSQTDLELAKTRYQQLLKDRQILWKS
jgi:phage-related protein